MLTTPEPECKAQGVASAHLRAVIVQRSSIKSEITVESISFFQDLDGGAGGGEGWIMGGELYTKKASEVPGRKVKTQLDRLHSCQGSLRCSLSS